MTTLEWSVNLHYKESIYLSKKTKQQQNKQRKTKQNKNKTKAKNSQTKWHYSNLSKLSNPYYKYLNYTVGLSCKLKLNPRPNEVFFVSRPPKAVLLQPLPGFSIWNAW